ncbi:MAG: hypothetical protein ABSD38_37940 [Syntrophorhabdales bacterium]|jgi:hypothetical protein
MKITEPIFIRKTEKRGYEITGRLEGYGTIRKYGRSAEEAKERFFEACDRTGNKTALTRGRRGLRTGIQPS